MPKAPNLLDNLSAIAPIHTEPAVASDTTEITARPRRVLPVNLSAIRVEKRLRNIDVNAVTRLGYSMGSIGLQSPISLRPDPGDPGLFILVAGAHRLEAARTLGWSSIEALIIDTTDQEHRLVEIDENLMRADLTPLDRARFLCERKKVFQQTNPHRSHGGDRKSGDYKTERASADTGQAPWANDTAEKIGLSPSTIHRAVSIGQGLSPELADAIAPTPLARREADLFKISKMSPGDQTQLLAAIETRTEPPTTLSHLLRPTQSKSTPDNAERLKRLWNAAAAEERQTFLSWLHDAGWMDVNNAIKIVNPTH